MENYVKQMLQWKEMLSFLERDYSQYSWSIRSLDCRLRYFEIYYRDENVSVEDVRAAVSKELEGPGKLLGYRAMQKKIRQEHDLNVPRDLVHAMMYELDADGLDARGLQAKRKKPKGHFDGGFKTVHIHWLFTDALTQQAGNCYGFVCGSLTLTL
jgi:hypothetical protein